jgi:hypothetical protein
MGKTRFISLDLWFLLGLGQFWSCHWSCECLIDKSNANGFDVKSLLN